MENSDLPLCFSKVKPMNLFPKTFFDFPFFLCYKLFHMTFGLSFFLIFKKEEESCLKE